MLECLKQKNPMLNILDVHDNAFAAFGSVIDDLDPGEIMAVAADIPMPDAGASYVPSEPRFERLAIAKVIGERFFGTLATQVGYCWGHSNFLNAAEWHASNEVNIAVTPLVLLLGKRCDMKEGRLSSSAMQAFYVPAGTVLEVYSTTLHFCPCEVSTNGFGCVVALPAGTNTPLDAAVDDRLLFRKNKWIVAHDQNEALLSRGVVAGIDGVNYEIQY